MNRWPCLLVLGGLLACSQSTSPTGATSMGTGTTSSGGAGGDAPVGGLRPVEVIVPSGYSATVPAPLLILLHGYSVSGQVEELYFQLGALADAHYFLFAHPDGTIDSAGKYFWNATDGCCNFDGSDVDDAGYLSALIEEIKGRYSVDPKRVYLVGHSNGGYMSYRMACEHADQLAAIVSLAGAMWLDPSKCAPSGPVSVLQIHGTADAEVAYAGDANAKTPSAETSVADWAGYDGCDPTPDLTSAPLDLDTELVGAETTVERYAKGCKPGGSAELWSIQGGSHVPNLSMSAREAIFTFLEAHPKP